jgi:BMFP domain-containing protein YqiC
MRDKNKRLKDVLPKLCQIMAKDFSDFRDDWEDVLKAYIERYISLTE